MTDGYDRRLVLTGSGEAIVLVPGMGGSDRLFYRQAPLLAERYCVATYALRDAAASMDELVQDLSAVIDAAAPQGRALIIGESFGGALALSFALRHPEKVSALVTLNSFPCFLPQGRLRLAIAGLHLMPWGAMRLVRRLTASRLHSRHTHQADIRKFFELTRDLSKEGYIGRLRMLQQYDVRSRLSEIRVPALFLAAEQDHLVPSVAQARFMAERVPNASMRVLDGHGHICLIAPDLDLAEMLDSWRRTHVTESLGQP